MTLNPRAVLRLSTRLTLSLIILCGLGMILWLIDSVLNWNILPDALDIYVELILVVFASITGLSILTSIICLLGITGEWISQKAHFDQSAVSKRSKKRILFGFIFIGILLFGFYIIDESKKKNATENADRLEAENYAKMSSTLDSSLSVNLASTHEIIARQLLNVDSNSLVLSQVMQAFEKSLPYKTSIEILILAKSPYKYEILSVDGYPQDSIVARQQLLSMPTKNENEVVADILKNSETNHRFSNDGLFFNGEYPHAWKVISYEESNIGILMAKSSYLCCP